MPVIPFVSPKGGCGKSTSAVLLASYLAESGRSVTIIDADPNRPVSRWSKRPGKPKNLSVLENVTEETIIKTIDRVRAGTEYVIVDLEGTASLMVAYAISRASLVVIPTQGSMLDAAEAVKAIRLVKRQEEAFKLTIPCAVLLTRTNAALRPRSLNAIEAEFVENGVKVFDVRLARARSLPGRVFLRRHAIDAGPGERVEFEGCAGSMPKHLRSRPWV